MNEEEKVEVRIVGTVIAETGEIVFFSEKLRHEILGGQGTLF